MKKQPLFATRCSTLPLLATLSAVLGLGLAFSGPSMAQAAAGSSAPLSSPIGSKSTPEPKAVKPVVAKAGDTAFREITWDELVPKDWDPLKEFKTMNLGLLSDADPKASAMLKRMRETWDNAPGNNAIDG